MTLERGGSASGGDASTVYRGFTDPAVCTTAATLESGVSQLCSNIGDISTAEKIYSQTVILHGLADHGRPFFEIKLHPAASSYSQQKYDAFLTKSFLKGKKMNKFENLTNEFKIF